MATSIGSEQIRDERRWHAVLSRNTRERNRFVYAVETTGIACRPGCPARTPKRENVTFFDTLAQAMRAGFRPCKRCRPERDAADERHRALVADACRAIEQVEIPPGLADLAARAGMSPSHFQRVFKGVMGVSPKQYAVGLRAGRIRRSLSSESSVSRAIYEAGYSTSGTFYDSVGRDLGMSPSSYRAAGVGEVITWGVARSTLGYLLVGTTVNGICAISLGDSTESLVAQFRERFRNAELVEGDSAFGETLQAVVTFVDRPADTFPLPLDARGTAFQLRVWQALRAIPPGTTRTYSEIAQSIGAPRSARAVARACASNTIAIAIPCHRVVRADGATGGYRWGANRKRKLIDRERLETTGD